MAKIVLGLDIGGANLKAATSAGRALSVPFAVWKQPEKLSGELRKSIAQFPEADEIAATMTAELCDCYETKREGVRRIVEDLKAAAKGVPIRVWSTEGKFVSPTAATKDYMKVAAANWHALATYCGRLVPNGHALLIDMGTTTTDMIMLQDGIPIPKGKTDYERLESLELWYAGWKRTSAAEFCPPEVAREYFASTYDACIVSKLISENPNDYDTADGRSATMHNCKARLARLKCSDIMTLQTDEINDIAYWITYALMYQLKSRLEMLFEFTHNSIKEKIPVLISGSGGFLVRAALRRRGHYFSEIKLPLSRKILLSDRIGENLSVAAPAYAVAILAAERRP